MAKKFVIRQVLDCSADVFWEHIFRSEEFNRFLYEGLGFDYRLELATPETGYRRAKVWPTTEMPRSLSAIFGDGFHYVEEGKFDPEAERYEFRVIPSAAQDRIRAKGVVRIEAMSENQCERVVDFDIDARVLGVGRLIESYLVAGTREQYAKNAALVNEYLSLRR